MRKQYPSKIFLPCMAHQMNLIFGEIFKEQALYQRILKEAVRLVSYFNKSVFFTGNLRDEQIRLYKKHVCLVSPGDTRWNSYLFLLLFNFKNSSSVKGKY